jgi:OmpA-OmpF porin, OOP family
MSIDLLGLVKDQLTSAAVGKISEFLGESHENTTKAVGAAVPTLLGSIMEKASSTDGAGSILNLLKDGGHDGSLDLGNALGSGDGISGLLSGGAGIISSLLGGKSGGIIDLITSVAGIKKSSSTSLLSMAAPILMSVIGKQVMGSGMGVSGLASMLMGQKDAVSAALPSGASSLLNMAGLGDFLGGKATVDATTSRVSNAASNVINEVEETSGGFNFWPWLLGAIAALGLGWFLLKGCDGKKAEGVADSLTTSVAVAGDSAMSIASAVGDSASSLLGAAGDMLKKTLPGGIEISGAADGIENKLVGFIEDKAKAVDKTTWFNFDRLLFDTGKSTLKAESMDQIKNMNEILKAYPNVNLKIGGYTDNTGKAAANMKLSGDRASAVMAELVKMGVDAKRLEAEGYGDAHPEATNDTEEGRAQNRRIAVRVTQK